MLRLLTAFPLAAFAALFFIGSASADEIVVQNNRVVLAPVKTNITCNSRELDKPYSTFWGWDRAERSDFIYFDRQAWGFMVCLNGRIITGALKRPSENSDLISVSVIERFPTEPNPSRRSTPYLEDLAGNGKTQFIGQIGFCGEGPCFGDSFVFQIEGDRIIQLSSVNSWVVTPFSEGGRKALEVEKDCFNYEFGVAFDYFAVAEFNSSGLQLPPYATQRQRFPEKFKNRLSHFTSPIAKLMLSAYEGKDFGSLETAYRAILTKDPSIADVHCKPLAILRNISRK